MGQYGNQPDFGTRAVAITPKGFAGGSYVNVSYQDSEGDTQNVYLTSTNLNVSTYNDGTLIPKATNLTEWNYYYNNDTACWAYSNFDDSYAKFGKIYNRWAAQQENGQVYPLGYQLWPSNVMGAMITNFGYNAELGNQLKSIPTGSEGQNVDGTTLWEYSTGGQGTDIFGFTALPGTALVDGEFDAAGRGTSFWSNDSGQRGELIFNREDFKYPESISGDGYYIRMQVDPTDVDYVAPQPLNSAALYVGTGGDLVVTIVGSETPVMFKNVPDASFLPIIVSNVWERGDDGLTTASDIIAIY